MDAFIERSRERRSLALAAGRHAASTYSHALELRELPDTAPMAPVFEFWSRGPAARAVALVSAHALGTALLTLGSELVVSLDDPADPDFPDLVEPAALDAAILLLAELTAAGTPKAAPGVPVFIHGEQEWQRSAIAALHHAAFKRNDEAALVDALRDTTAWIAELALVARQDTNRVAGHLLLTRAQVDGTEVLALAPVAVLPELQNQGIGEHLVAHALMLAAGLGHRAVVVLGDPAYYARFGFRPARELGIKPPADWPDEAFQARRLSPDPLPRGTMRYPEPFGV